MKQFAPSLPVSAVHKTLTFRLKQEVGVFSNLPVSSGHSKAAGRRDWSALMAFRNHAGKHGGVLVSTAPPASGPPGGAGAQGPQVVLLLVC